MKELIQVLTLSAACSASVFGLIFGILRYRRERLRNKLRRALTDCLAFYELEKMLCAHIASMQAGGATELSVKRMFRAKLRDRKEPTPSDHATPIQMRSELSWL